MSEKWGNQSRMLSNSSIVYYQIYRITFNRCGENEVKLVEFRNSQVILSNLAYHQAIIQLLFLNC